MDETKAKGKFHTLASHGKYITLLDQERKDYKASKAKWRSEDGFKSYIGKATLNIPNPFVAAREPYVPKIDLQDFRDKQDPSKFVGKGWQV